MNKRIWPIFFASFGFIIFIALLMFVDYEFKNQNRPTSNQTINQALDSEKKNLGKKIITELYKNITGFIRLSPEERACIEGGYTKKCSTYGEISYDSLQYILDREPFSPNDIVYDLGSGVGKVVMQIFLNTPAHKVIGLELSASRNSNAQQALNSFQSMLHYSRYKYINNKKRELAFHNEDILKANIDDATIIYMCSTCFAPELLEKLVDKFEAVGRKGIGHKELKIITLKELPDYQAHGFHLDRTYSLSMSWSKNGATSPVFVYTYMGNKEKK